MTLVKLPDQVPGGAVYAHRSTAILWSLQNLKECDFGSFKS